MVRFDAMWENIAGTAIVAIIVYWLVQGSFEALVLGGVLFIVLAWHGLEWAGW